MNHTYQDIRNFTQMFRRNIAADVRFFVECVAANKEVNKKPPLPLLALSINNYVKKLNVRIKHNHNKVNTAKWMKKRDEVEREEQNAFGKFVIQFNNAHYFQVQVLKYLWLIEAKHENLTLKDTPEYFSQLVKSLNILDSSDKEALNTFNELRNIIAHSPMSVINTQLKEKQLYEINILLEYLATMNKSIADNKSENIVSLVIKELEIRNQDDVYWEK